MSYELLIISRVLLIYLERDHYSNIHEAIFVKNTTFSVQLFGKEFLIWYINIVPSGR